jgi:hemerythrin
MSKVLKIQVAKGVYWIEVPEAEISVLCGCPADSVKHLMKRGLIVTVEKDGRSFETGPNVILLSDISLQNGHFSNLAEFPVLQMLYRQGMILPAHPNNTGVKPLLVGSEDQVKSQMQYIYRGNYGLVSEKEITDSGVSEKEAREMMRLKIKFAFGKIKTTEELLDCRIVRDEPVEIRNGLFIRRLRLNVFEFQYENESVKVDLNLPPNEVYEAPYPLGFHDIKREYFGVVHAGEGDGWDINRQCMCSILVYQGKIYLIDAVPNILHTLRSLGIGVNEIEGIFHTHAHDDHFSGLPIIMQSDHKIKYYATPLVRASVFKKLSALLSRDEESFSEYFEIHDLKIDEWNDINGLDVKPIFSPHPVETTIFIFRTMFEGGYRSYAHFADIARFEVLRSMITEDDTKYGISQEYFDRVKDQYLTTVDLKKIDIGGGLIHGDAVDFKEDGSQKIILSHTSSPLTNQQKEIGSGASFGSVEVLIPAHQDYTWIWASTFLRFYFSTVPDHQTNMLLNNPLVTLNPESILFKKGHVNQYIYLILTGNIEVVHPETNSYHILSAGAFVGGDSGLAGKPIKETYRALNFVKALKLPVKLCLEFVKRNGIYDEIEALRGKREFLQNSWLFGDAISFVKQLVIAREMISHRFEKGDRISCEDKPGILMVKQGKFKMHLDEYTFEILKEGDFFGEGGFLFGVPEVFRIQALNVSEIYHIDSRVLYGIPIVHWKLYETYERRMRMIMSPEVSSIPIFEWREEYSTNVKTFDETHKTLFEMANQLYEGINRGQVRSVKEDTLNFLLRYAEDHFAEEERLMQQHDYPELDSHRKKHEYLKKEILHYNRRFAAGESFDDIDFIKFMKDWIVDHILTVDRKYGPFLNKMGVF